MRKFIITAFLIAFVLICGTACDSHVCANICSDCGLCLNVDCTETVCSEKCQGHHKCENVCPDCGLCLDTNCSEDVCKDKCPGHHRCENVCPDCGLCLNVDCTESVCSEKCQGHHKCENVCPDCGLCLNVDCMETVCSEKCQGHHKCENVCPDCGLCLNTNCSEDVCKDKCPGHHRCENICLDCGLCLNVDCTETVCSEKCPGHHKCESKCKECGLCLDSSCKESVCSKKCQGHHKCESKCKECGLCLNDSCKESVCSKKCQGHHKCESKCKECGLCLDDSCKESVCSKKCQGHHKCESKCEECGKCYNEKCTEDICSEKCKGHKETVCKFPSDSFITKKDTSIDTGKVVYDIDKNIYIPGHFKEINKIMVSTIEKVSGLTFEGNGSANPYEDNKVHVHVTKNDSYVDFDWYTGLKTNEFVVAYANSSQHAVVGPGDMMFGGGTTLIHELTHVLRFRQSDWSFCLTLEEGFAEYTTYLVLNQMEKSNLEAANYFETTNQLFLNMTIDKNMSVNYFEKLYEHPIEYWFENTFDYVGNHNYTIGFRFMAYLDDVYGDYTKWVKKAAVSDVKWEIADQINLLKETYGEKVLSGFYKWMRDHEDDFKYDYYAKTDISGIINLYPVYNAIHSRAFIDRVNYEDLYINIETVREYVEDYKKFDASELYLELSPKITVNLYKKDGSYFSVSDKKNISLDGISYIKLVGSGYADLIEVVGFAD